ncbi:NAD-dependent deacetylase, partial [Streptomyces sp. NPDC004596]
MSTAAGSPSSAASTSSTRSACSSRPSVVLHPPMPCDSGIPDYRGPDGLWRRDPETEKLVTY